MADIGIHVDTFLELIADADESVVDVVVDSWPSSPPLRHVPKGKYYKLCVLRTDILISS